MAAQVTSSISTIFNGYTNPPITNPKAPRPSPPTSLRLQGGFLLISTALQYCRNRFRFHKANMPFRDETLPVH